MVSAARLRSDEGTTLAELLVVIALLGTIGLVTTTGIVRAFNAQLTEINVSETLDGTRIATQRVRDFVRGADEVCTGSTQDQLVLWSDDDDDGAAVAGELDVFELIGPVGDEVFQRRVPDGSGNVQLIRDDVINNTLFEYGFPANQQPTTITCDLAGDGTTTVAATGAQPSEIRTVDVQFRVDNPDPDPLAPDLTTETTVRLRNAGLADGPTNIPPNADFTVSCPDPDRSCDFDASASTDSDGSVVSYAWEFVDAGGISLGTATGVTASFTFPVGNVDYDVTLTVTDDVGATDSATKVATPVAPGSNPPPTAAFTVSCTGRDCTFDASGSSDDDGIVTYDWDFGGIASASETTDTTNYTFPSSGTYTVTLVVTDTDGATDTTDETFFAGNEAIFVSSTTGVRGGSGNAQTATVTVQLERTTGGPPGAGIQISVLAEYDKNRSDEAGSCTTTSSGSCAITFTGLKNVNFPVDVTVTNVTSTGSFVYDDGLNTDDTATIS